jgi:hypothetical protein
VSGNSGFFAGAIWNDGTATLRNSTVSGNSCYLAGAIRNSRNGTAPYGALTLINSTLTRNTTHQGADLQTDGGTLTIRSSLIAGDCSADPSGSPDVASVGHNIESPGDTCGFDQSTDQVNVTAEQLALGPLQDNGGPTETHALGAGSMAIDAIPEGDCVDADGQPLTTDQRGEPRPETGGTMCDVGAFEVQP